MEVEEKSLEMAESLTVAVILDRAPTERTALNEDSLNVGYRYTGKELLLTLHEEQRVWRVI